MLQRLKKWLGRPVDVLTSRENTLIIQAYPKKNILYVSYKGKVKTAHFSDRTMRNMMRGGIQYKEHADQFLSVVGQLIYKIINE